MRPGRSLLALALALSAEFGCSHLSPAAEALKPLCGTWQSHEDLLVTESWWIVRGGLDGRGSTGNPDGRVIALENMTLRTGRDGTVYHAEPAGGVPVDFTEITDPGVVPAAGEQVWIWANPAHDFPRRIVYRLAGDRLTATISNPDGDEAQRVGTTWQFRRIAACEQR